MLILDALRRFSEEVLYLRKQSPETVMRHTTTARLFVRITRVERLEDVTEEHVREFFVHGCRSRGWRDVTYRTRYICLVVFFRWCVQRGFMSENCAERIEKPRIGKTMPKALTAASALAVLRAADVSFRTQFERARARAIIATFIYAGLRRNEVLNLVLSDLDLATGVILVRQGKGNKDRLVPICAALRTELQRYALERDRARPACDAFFTCVRGERAMTVDAMRRLIKSITAHSGIRFSAHPLRHTFATLMLEGGCDIYALSRMLGHSDIKTTTIYLAASTQHLRSQVNKHPLNTSSPVTVTIRPGLTAATDAGPERASRWS